jgi:hypothetical protein
MMPKSQNVGVGEALQKHPLLCNGLLQNVFEAMNIHTTLEELLGAVFSIQSLTKLYK